MAPEIRNLTVRYGNRNILQDVSISFDTPLTYIAGLNGSGKSTLFRAISGEVPYTGSIRLHGQESRSLHARERARLLGRVYQHLRLPFDLTVADYVLAGRFPHTHALGRYTAQDHARTEEALHRMQLTALQGALLHTLSGGEMQRTQIARVLAQEAPILLADEPAQQLDPPARAAVYTLLRELAAQGMTVLCITHDADALSQSGARILGLRAGKVVWDDKSGSNAGFSEAVYGSPAPGFFSA